MTPSTPGSRMSGQYVVDSNQLRCPGDSRHLLVSRPPRPSTPRVPTGDLHALTRLVRPRFGSKGEGKCEGGTITRLQEVYLRFVLGVDSTGEAEGE